MEEKKLKELLGTIGLCEKAGRLVLGTDQICEALRTGRKAPVAVLEASDTSDNTHKRLCDRCAYYGVTLDRIEADTVSLGAAVGKERAVAAVGITDAGLAALVRKKLV